MILIWEILLKLESKQGDATAAVLHIDLGEDKKVYVEICLDFGKKERKKGFSNSGKLFTVCVKVPGCSEII